MSKTASRDSRTTTSKDSSKGKSSSVSHSLPQGTPQQPGSRGCTLQSHGSLVVKSPVVDVTFSSRKNGTQQLDPRTNEWKNFFLDSGIPDHASFEYATVFVKERINWQVLKNLDKGYLTDMGINCIGDQIAILQAAKKYCGEQYTPSASANPKPLSFGSMRVDMEENAASAGSKASSSKARDSDKVEIANTSSSGSPRKVVRNEVSSTTAVRSVVKSAKSPADTVVTVRAKRPADDEDDKEHFMVKKLSMQPAKQVRERSPAADTVFTVRMGPGPVKRDVFSRLTPKGVKSSHNTNLVRVLENKMSRLSTGTGPAAAEPQVNKPKVATLVSDSIDQQTPVFSRLGSTFGRPHSSGPSRTAASGSTVFSRLGLQSNFATKNSTSMGNESRSRGSVKDRLGYRK